MGFKKNKPVIQVIVLPVQNAVIEPTIQEPVNEITQLKNELFDIKKMKYIVEYYNSQLGKGIPPPHF
jgi:hypothetical protein